MIFIDSNILVYALDPNENEKHAKAKEIITRGLKGELSLAISNQTIGECCNVLLHKYERPPDRKQLSEFFQTIIRAPSIRKLTYTCTTAIQAGSPTFQEIHFWDAVIGQTMLENGITKIYTENTKDFSKIKGIKAVNPFKKH